MTPFDDIPLPIDGLPDPPQAELDVSPDCAAGKHTSCTGDGGWNDHTADVVPCDCRCHPAGA
jgi:hypothetical protein